MPSTIDLAARLSAVIAMQQEVLAAATDPAKVMSLVAERTREITRATGAVIEIVHGEDLVYRAGSGSAARHIGSHIPIEDSLSGLCVRKREVMRCDDSENDPRVDAAACRDIGVRSMIVAPLVHGAAAIGALKTYSDKPSQFDDLDAYAVELMAGMTSAALMLASQFTQHQAAEERYRLLFERNIAGVFRTTLEGRILDCNRAFADTLGYGSREELLGRETWDLYPQRSDRVAFIERLQREQAMTNVRLHLKRKDGSDLAGVVNVSLIPADSGETQLLGTLVEE
jgi:PAS domain S-box-containing protein